MSLAVSIEALAGQVEQFGEHPYLVTVGAGAAAHVVSVRARLSDGLLVATAGRTSRANAAAHPGVTLLWAAAPGGQYSLIVDGDAEVDEEREMLAVHPTRAVLHRLAGAPEDIATCIRLDGEE